MKFLYKLGSYLIFIRKAFSRPEKRSVYTKEVIVEFEKLGLNSIVLVVIISFFIGAVLTLQTAYNMQSPLLPRYLIGYLTRETMLLEFSSTIVSLILAGKIGSNIASEIGSMRITEQIEALETMGVNSVSYLVGPKILASLVINPILYIFSVFIGILGGIISGLISGVVNFEDFVYGLHFSFNPYYVTYSIVKTLFFAFIFTSIPAFYGYYVQGGAREVGKAGTKAVVDSSIAILTANLVLTQMIRVEALGKSFDNKKVLSDIDITFEAGKVNLIIGKSGSGKTVLLKSLIGLHSVTTGHIYYGDRDLTTMNSKQLKSLREEIGVVFQGGALFDSQTVLENVMFPLNLFSDLSYEEKRERALFCLHRVELNKAEDLYPSEISGGMKKRVAIARAIVLQPKFLFCDEPNSGLDPLTSIVIDNLISELTHEYNMTTVVNTHDMNSVFEIGEKIVFIHEGRKEWEGSKEQIAHTDNPYLNEFIFSSQLFKLIKKDL